MTNEQKIEIQAAFQSKMNISIPDELLRQMELILHPKPPCEKIENMKQIIITQVCNYFNKTADQLMRKCNKQEVCFPRQIIQYLLYKYCPALTIMQIGIITGRFDHATVMHSRKTIENYLRFHDYKSNVIIYIESQVMTFAGLETEEIEKPKQEEKKKPEPVMKTRRRPTEHQISTSFSMYVNPHQIQSKFAKYASC